MLFDLFVLLGLILIIVVAGVIVEDLFAPRPSRDQRPTDWKGDPD